MSDIHPVNLSDEYAPEAGDHRPSPPLALRAAKQSLRAAQEVGFSAGLVQERQLFTLLERHRRSS